MRGLNTISQPSIYQVTGFPYLMNFLVAPKQTNSSPIMIFSWWLLQIFILPVTLQARTGCFDEQYVGESFAKGMSFENVSDIAVNINAEWNHVFVLQRSYPPVTVWSTNGTFLFAWSNHDIGYPHSITINGSNPLDATVWITDMAGDLAAGRKYGHCIKGFTYSGKYIQSIGECGKNTSGSGLDPPQFDRVTDIAFNSKGYFYVTDGAIGGINNRVLVFDSNIRLVDVWNKENKPGNRPLQFDLPHSVALDKCDRVWIVDTQNHRLQIISENGTFLGQWNCFGRSLIYGIDFHRSSSVVLTAISGDGYPEVLFIPLNTTNCVNQSSFGTCSIQKRLILKQNSNPSISKLLSVPMLHSVVSQADALYLAELPGSIPPLKLHLAPPPQISNTSACSGFTNPPPWQAQWNATVLLTPYNDSALKQAKVEYSADLLAMYVAIQGIKYTKEYLNIDNETYILERNSTTIGCKGPYNFGWVTPTTQWLASHKCECKGFLNISGTQTISWRCPMYGVVDWYWFHESNHNIWRMFFNNQTNPNHLPVLGDFTMVHFASHGTDIDTLKVAYDVCVKEKTKYNGTSLISSDQPYPAVRARSPVVEGFSYIGCSEMTNLPSWPEYFYTTVTMLPVLHSIDHPLPTTVVYDWQRQSQRTTMCESLNSLETYSAYLIGNNTYIIQEKLKSKTVKCCHHLKFGPPVPNWMTKDKCKCMGTITNNSALSPSQFTAIVICPLVKGRVFWVWFTNDTGYSPLLFFETLPPVDEGTGLALADYHSFYSKNMLIHQHDFEVPSKCLHTKRTITKTC